MSKSAGPGLRARWQRVLAVAASVVIIVVTIVAIVEGVYIAENRSIIQQMQQEGTTTCAYWRDVGSGAILPAGDPGRPLLVLVADSRTAFIGKHCTGTLPPLTSAALHWSAVYRVMMP